ncbi:uncharacterized protein ISCGN_026211 [Ixodes scapularis]
MPVVSLFSFDNMAAPTVAPCLEALILEVERSPWLWNASRMDYRDTAKRENSWKAIGIALDLLMEAYSPQEEDEGPSGVRSIDSVEDTRDSMLEDFEPSETCEVLLQLEQNRELPTSVQLVPAQPPASQHAPVQQHASPAQAADQPPAKKRARKVGRANSQEEEGSEKSDLHKQLSDIGGKDIPDSKDVIAEAIACGVKGSRKKLRSAAFEAVEKALFTWFLDTRAANVPRFKECHNIVGKVINGECQSVDKEEATAQVKSSIAPLLEQYDE